MAAVHLTTMLCHLKSAQINIVYRAVYMEASCPGKRAGSVAKTNYFLRLYAAYRDGI